MKMICIAGRLGKDAVLRRTQQGDAALGFSVAVDDGYGQNKRTLWFECTVWGKRAEALEQYLKKGTAVAVSGDLSTRQHEQNTYLTVRVNEVTMQGGGEKRQTDHSDDREPINNSVASRAGYGSGTARPPLDDDIPFSPEWR